MKKDAFAFAAALAMFSFAGCSNKDNSLPNNNSNNNTSEETGTFVSEEIPEAVVREFEIETFIDFPEMNYINDIEYKNGRVCLSGVRDSAAGTIRSFYMTDFSGSQYRQPDLKEIGSAEYALPVPDGIVCIYYESDSRPLMVLCDPDTGKTLKKSSRLYEDDEYFISNILASEQGKIVVIKHDFSGLYSSDPSSGTASVTADVYSSDLVKIKSFDLMELCNQEYDNFGDIIISGNSILCESIVDADGKTNAVIHEISLDDYTVTDTYEFNEKVVSSGMFIDSAGELCIIPDVFSGMYEDFTYYKLDRTERTFSKYTEDISDVQKFCSGNEQYDIIYISNEDGSVCGYSFGTHEKTVIAGAVSDEAGIDNDTEIFVNNDQIIVMAASYLMQSSIVSCSMNSDGSDRQYSFYEYNDMAGYGFSKMCTDSIGDMYGFVSVENLNENDPDYQESDAADRHLLYHYSKNTGKLINKADLSEEIGTGESLTADWMSADEKGNVCLVYHTDGTLGLDRTFILITDINGNILLHESVTDSCSSAYYSSGSGKLITAGFNGIEMFSIDTVNGTAGSAEKIEAPVRGERIIKIYPGDSEYDFYCSDIRELYGFRTEEKICDKVFSRDYSYDHNYDITMFCPISDGKLFCQAYDSENRPRLCVVAPK